MIHFAVPLVLLAALAHAQDSRPASRPAPPAPRPAVPAAPDPESDPKAVALAARVLEAMGGQAGLDQLHCLRWTFMGTRTHVWDRQNGRHRVDIKGQGGKTTVILRDLKAGTCRAFVNGEEIGDEAELADHKANAEGMFVNDTYWFLFPAKLLDPGVVLTLEADQKVDDQDCQVLRVRFKNVGLTPTNQYQAFVDKKTARVVRWTWYRTKEAAGVTWDWGPYERVGPVWLASKHKAVGHKRDVDISELQVFAQAKDEWFAPPGGPAEGRK